MTKKNSGHMMARWLILCLLITILYPYIYRVNASALKDLQNQQESVQQEIDALEQAKAELEESLKGMNSQLYDVTASINDLQDQITQKQEEIAHVEVELAEAEELAKEQYESMKIRIQFMYENGGLVSWTNIFASGSMSSFLNHIQYASDLTAYDRLMLEEYQENQEQIATYKQTLEEEEKQLFIVQEELANKEAVLLASISDAQSNITAADEELEQQLAAMEEFERKIEEQKAIEEAARLEEIKKEEEESKDSIGQPVTPQTGEEELLAALIFCEAGGEPYAGQLAVGSVVLNRVNSPYFADTITGVIYQKGQFSPAASGRLAVVLERGLTTDSCRKAAREVLSGNITGNWLYFRVDNGLIDGTIIGKQVFY